MFSKPTKPNQPGSLQRSEMPSALPVSSAPDASRKPRVASLVSADITIEGNVSGDGELQIDGVVRGDVRVGRLTIGDTGHVEGSVTAEAIEVRGRVIGSLCVWSQLALSRFLLAGVRRVVMRRTRGGGLRWTTTARRRWSIGRDAHASPSISAPS